MKTTLISAGAGLAIAMAYFFLNKKYRRQKKQVKLQTETDPQHTPIQSIAG